FEVLHASAETGIAGDWIRQLYPRIERADGDRLPTAARKAGDRHSFRISVFQTEQHVQAALQGQIEGRQAAGAAQIELIHAAMFMAYRAQLPHAEPFWVQGEHPPFGQVNAGDLLVVCRLAIGVVAVDIEDNGDLSGKLLGLVQQSRNPQAGQSLIAEFLDLVARTALDLAEPFDSKPGIAPNSCLASVNDFR